MGSVKKQVEAALSVLAEARGEAPKRTTRSKSTVRLYRWSGGPGGSTDVSWGATRAQALERARFQHGCKDARELAREYPDAVVESVTVCPTAHAIAQLLEDVENYVHMGDEAASPLTGLIID